MNKFVVEIGSHVLTIKSLSEVKELVKLFGVKRNRYYGINWTAVAEHYNGIEVINPRKIYWDNWENHDDIVAWLYTWDVSGGCIWNKEGIKHLIHYNHLEFKPDQRTHISKHTEIDVKSVQQKKFDSKYGHEHEKPKGFWYAFGNEWIDFVNQNHMSDRYDDITISKKEAQDLGIIGDAGLGFVQKDLFKQINKRVLEYIEKNEQLPWRKPWRDGYRIKGTTYGPQNYVTGNPYRGANAYTIMLHNIFEKRNDVYFLTKKQIHDRGGSLNATAKPIFVWAFIKGKDKKKGKDGREKEYTYQAVVTYIVYAIGDTTGVQPIKHRTIKTDTTEEVIASAETVIEGMPKRPPIKNDGGNEAYYSPASDSVHMPVRKAFHKKEGYYSVLFHELIHSTGHSKRLDRGNDTRKRDKSKEDKKAYAFEELIAEIGAAYLCGVTNIDYESLKNTAAYLKGWGSRLKELVGDDRSFFFRAVLGATKAAKYIIGNTLLKHGEKTEEKKVKMELNGIKDPGLQIIYQYVKLHDTTVTKAEVKKLIKELQRSIKSGDIQKTHHYAEQIAYIQEQLVKLYNKMPSKIHIQIAKGAEYKEILERELSGLGFFPVVVAAAAGKLIEHVTHKALSKDKKSVDGLDCACTDPIEIPHKGFTIKLNPVPGLKTPSGETAYQVEVSNEKKEYVVATKGPAGDKEKATKTGRLMVDNYIARTTKKKEDPAQAQQQIIETNTTGKNLSGFVRCDKEETAKAPDTFKLSGEIGKFVQDIQPYKYSIVLTGDPHAGKTEFVWQLADAFAGAGIDVDVYDLEQGGLASKDTRAAKDRNVKPENQKRIQVTGEAKNGLKTIKENAPAKGLRAVIVDSYQKLKASAADFDTLRSDRPNIIWIVIFQQNAEGNTRGGNAADYDSPVHMKVHRVDFSFKNNYVELKKNRGNDLGVQYMIADKKTIPLTINSEENGKNK